MKLSYLALGALCLSLTASSIASEARHDEPLNIVPMIIGGEQTIANQVPFFARLILYKTGSIYFVNSCGGSIVNDRFILTAAHCVEPSAFTNGYNVDDLRVLVKNPAMYDWTVEELKDVRAVTIHPAYDNNKNYINDIAILELTYPITDNVQSITLPQEFGDYSNASVYQIFGLGLTSDNDLNAPDYLRWAELKPLSDPECASMISGFNAQESLCAGPFPDRDYTSTCYGDSGGPLTYQDINGDYQQIGITSYGGKMCEDATYPSVFTEILNYTTWIEAQTSTGVKTVYDADRAREENYYSEGDAGQAPVNSITSSGGGGGTLGWGWVLLGAGLVWSRRRG